MIGSLIMKCGFKRMGIMAIKTGKLITKFLVMNDLIKLCLPLFKFKLFKIFTFMTICTIQMLGFCLMSMWVPLKSAIIMAIGTRKITTIRMVEFG